MATCDKRIQFERNKLIFTVSNIDLSATVYMNVHMHAKYNSAEVILE